MKGRISTWTLVRLMLAIAVIVLAPVLLRYWNSSPEPSSDQIVPHGKAAGSGTIASQTASTSDASAATAPPVRPFKPVERKPILLRQPNPGYPEFAQLLHMEGTVVVKVLVDKRGHPKRAFVVKSDSKVFDDAARKAAMEARFQPALMNSGPVSCWVLVPYRFKIG